jgi:antitoxin VapB
LPGRDAVIRKEGERLIIKAAPAKSLLDALANLTPLREKFSPIRELASSPVEF